MPRNYLYVGAEAPASVLFTVLPGDTLADLSTVTSADILTRSGRDGMEETWDCAIEEQTADTLVVRHTCPSPSHHTDPDRVRMVLRLYTPGGTYRCAPRTLWIRRL